MEETHNLKLVKMKELTDDLQGNVIRLNEQKKCEEAKSINVAKLLAKKEKEMEEWMMR